MQSFKVFISLNVRGAAKIIFVSLDVLKLSSLFAIVGIHTTFEKWKKQFRKQMKKYGELLQYSDTLCLT